MLIDTHAHLDLYGDDQLEAVLNELNHDRILTVSNSMDPKSYRRNREIAGRCAYVVPIFGIHPWRARQYVDRLNEVGQAVKESPMLGEIGLDYYWVKDESTFPAQRKVFEFLLKCAEAQGKIVNLHTKGAEAEVLACLGRHESNKTVLHWYSGPLDLVEEFVSTGAYFSIGIEVLHSEHIRQMARVVPDHLVLSETDNPGGQQWLTGSPGRPEMLKQVVEMIADLRNSTYHAMVETIAANFRRLIADSDILQNKYDSLSH